MGEMPKLVFVQFMDGPVTLIVYVCRDCQVLFAVGADVLPHGPLCPICGSLAAVEMLEDFT